MTGALDLVVGCESDASVLAALHAAAFEAPWTADALATLLASPGCFALVARITKPPGTGSSGPDISESNDPGAGMLLARIAGDDCEIITVGVPGGFRRRGIAALLLDHAAVRGAGLGAVRQVLEVGTDNTAARRLYARLGFAQCGSRPGYYAETGGDAVILARGIPIVIRAQSR